MAAPSTSPPDSSVAQFDSGDPGADETKEGTDYSDPDSQGEPAIMLSQGQADAAGMTGAMPGDTYTVKITVAMQNDDGWNVQLEPGSAVKDPGPSMGPEDAPAMNMTKNQKIKGPGDLGMPTGLGASPSILNA